MASTINASTSAGLISTGDTSGVLALQTNSGTTAVTIDTSQRVGIGTTSPTSPLQVNTAGVNTTVQINSTDANGGYGAVLALNNTGTGGRQYAIYSTSNADGDVGGGKFKFYDVTASTTRMLIDSSGNLLVPQAYNNTTPSGANGFIAGNGTFQRSTSSLKYKTNIQDSTHGLAELLKLRSVTYQSKNPEQVGTFGGLIAEEVHEVGLEEFVQYAEDGTPDALSYGNMVSLCVKAIQELKAINDQQAETINALTARVVALESK